MLAQAVQLLGMTADELAPLKDGGADGKEALEAVFKKAQFTEWQLRVQTRTRCPQTPSTLRSECPKPWHRLIVAAARADHNQVP